MSIILPAEENLINEMCVNMDGVDRKDVENWVKEFGKPLLAHNVNWIKNNSLFGTHLKEINIITSLYKYLHSKKFLLLKESEKDEAFQMYCESIVRLSPHEMALIALDMRGKNSHNWLQIDQIVKRHLCIEECPENNYKYMRARKYILPTLIDTFKGMFKTKITNFALEHTNIYSFDTTDRNIEHKHFVLFAIDIEKDSLQNAFDNEELKAFELAAATLGNADSEDCFYCNLDADIKSKNYMTYHTFQINATHIHELKDEIRNAIDVFVKNNPYDYILQKDGSNTVEESQDDEIFTQKLASAIILQDSATKRADELKKKFLLQANGNKVNTAYITLSQKSILDEEKLKLICSKYPNLEEKITSPAPMPNLTALHAALKHPFIKQAFVDAGIKMSDIFEPVFDNNKVICEMANTPEIKKAFIKKPVIALSRKADNAKDILQMKDSIQDKVDCILDEYNDTKLELHNSMR